MIIDGTESNIRLQVLRDLLFATPVTISE